jgi:hypothetical protein
LLLTLALEQAVLHDNMHEVEALFVEREKCIESLSHVKVQGEELDVLRKAQLVESRVMNLLLKLRAETAAELNLANKHKTLNQTQAAVQQTTIDRFDTIG